MASNVTNIISTIAVDEVQRVIISEKANLDPSGFIRTIRIYGTPGGVNADPVLTIQLKATDEEKISIHAPETSF